jgi:hypothetical protein
MIGQSPGLLDFGDLTSSMTMSLPDAPQSDILTPAVPHWQGHGRAYLHWLSALSTDRNDGIPCELGLAEVLKRGKREMS